MNGAAFTTFVQLVNYIHVRHPETMAIEAEYDMFVVERLSVDFDEFINENVWEG